MLRTLMKDKKIDHILIPSCDWHKSEYICDHFKFIRFLSGFTGSAATLVISLDKAALFTDGRYYIQAEKQLCGTGIDLMRSGMEGVPTVEEYIVNLMKNGGTLAFDGRCIDASFYLKLKKKLPTASFVFDIDFAYALWEDRPPLPCQPIFRLDIKYAGKTHFEKLSELRKEIAAEKADGILLSDLCEIAWLYNLRGNDIQNTPVFMAYSLITQESDILFVDKASISDAEAHLTLDNVEVRDYPTFFDSLSQFSDKRLIADLSCIGISIADSIGIDRITDKKSPVSLMKSVKNETELKNLRLTHIADGLAVARLTAELKYGTDIKNELDVAKRVYELRREAAEQVGVTLIGESFNTIAAFGANAAMMHYSATEESYSDIDQNSPDPILLVDSGGQYLEGTTDITRTVILGNISGEIKLHYTLTACAMLRLASLTFPDGASGAALDVVCRQLFWERGLDYRCGTGHGVGYLLSVHEGPNRFHWRSGTAPLKVGMITTDEPGVYVEGSHGIRIENELLTVEKEKNEYARFLTFEPITFCPIDPDGIDSEIMDKSDIKRFNEYHDMVYNTLLPYLGEDEKDMIRKLTRHIK